MSIILDHTGAPMQAETRLARRGSNMMDGWQNAVTGFGTSRDKTEYTRFYGPDWLSDIELSNLFAADDIAQRMICARPDEMLREGYIVDVDDKVLNQELADFTEQLDVSGKFNEAMRWGRLFGAGGLLVGADDGRSAARPLEPERAADLSYLYVIDKRYIQPNSWYTEPGHPKLGKPETYFVTAASAHGGEVMAIVHETRLILFGGAPTDILAKEVNNGFDRSVLQAAYNVLRSFNVGFKALEVLLTDGFQAVFKMAGLKEALAAEDDTGYVATRMANLDMSRSGVRAIMIDAGTGQEGEGEEAFDRNNITLTGVPESLDKLMLRLAASVKTPVTILMGQSPAGMNATGQSDFRWWYDDLRSEQNLRLAPVLRRLYRIALKTKRFNKPEAAKAITIKFPPLWTETPKEAAETRKALLDGDNILVQGQAWLPEEWALARLQPDGMRMEPVLDDKARTARKDAVESELELLVEQAGEPEEPPPAPGGFGGKPGGGAPFGGGGRPQPPKAPPS